MSWLHLLKPRWKVVDSFSPFFIKSYMKKIIYETSPQTHPTFHLIHLLAEVLPDIRRTLGNTQIPVAVLAFDLRESLTKLTAE
jgi:hypothetical protein